MAHEHILVDTDAAFSIDENTREISIMAGVPNIVQYDHNSERLSFELPRFIDSHDMMQCNDVQIHYININASNIRESHADVYDVTDLKISDDDENKVVLSWLVSRAATQYAGSLNFVVKFKCIAADGTVDYSWSSAIYKGLTVSDGMDNGAQIEAEYSDILAEWENRIAQMEFSGGGTVKSVNGVEPDQNGNVVLEIETGGVKTVNNIAPDGNGNVQIEVGSGASSWNDLTDKPELVGKNVAGAVFTLGDGTKVTAGTGAEIFNYHESFAKWKTNVASGEYSHAEGSKTQATGNNSHAEGNYSKATGDNSHAEGDNAKASGLSSHAEGSETTASGQYSHAEGASSVSSGYANHAEGWWCYAQGSAQHAQGKYNIKDSANTYAHIVGNGTGDGERANIHTIDWYGNGWFAGAVSSTGADYAEHFEWLDGNPNNEDRVGTIVTLEGDKIRPADADDEVLGIVSGTAMVIGDNAECEWRAKFLTDDYGRVITEMVEEFVEIENPDTGETERKSIGFFPQRKINPEWDETKKYIRRSDRTEWEVVGLFGKLYVSDDGSCMVGGYATNGENGVATASEEKTNMRVMKRITDNIVLVFMK